ncbi:MAG: hypothetical protein MI861_23130, partial [Pirellulales bacterium]|nr:hypothetical protein [Pirellulales bacterium]
ENHELLRLVVAFLCCLAYATLSGKGSREVAMSWRVLIRIIPTMLVAFPFAAAVAALMSGQPRIGWPYGIMSMLQRDASYVFACMLIVSVVLIIFVELLGLFLAPTGQSEGASRARVSIRSLLLFCCVLTTYSVLLFPANGESQISTGEIENSMENRHDSRGR